MAGAAVVWSEGRRLHVSVGSATVQIIEGVGTVVELKEIEEKIIKIVEVRPDAKYLIVFQRGAEDLAEEWFRSGGFNKLFPNSAAIIVRDANDIRVLEIERD